MGFAEFRRRFEKAQNMSPTKTNDIKKCSSELWSPQLLVQFKNEIWTENSACEWNLKSVKMAMEVEQNQNHQLGFPFWKPLRHRFGPESPFFAPGNLERELLAKQVFFSFFFSHFQIVWCLINGYKYRILRWQLLLTLSISKLALELTEEKQQLEKWMQEEEGRYWSLYCWFHILNNTWDPNQCWYIIFKCRASSSWWFVIFSSYPTIVFCHYTCSWVIFFKYNSS